jgi:ATP-binding cassette subfamily F protein uup
LDEAKQQNKKGNTAPTPVAAPVAKKSKLSFKEAKELETIEAEITVIENSIKAKTDELNKVGIELAKLNETIAQIADLNKKLDAKSARWMELMELNEA